MGARDVEATHQRPARLILLPLMRTGASMQRSEYLKLREDQESVSAAVPSWDTLSLPELDCLETHLATRLSRDQERLAAASAAPSRGQAEAATFVRNGTSLIMYLRALRYLREHNIAPSWPRGSVATA